MRGFVPSGPGAIGCYATRNGMRWWRGHGFSSPTAERDLGRRLGDPRWRQSFMEKVA